ncbi:MAG: phospho-sugar mutase [Flavobacteriales bacterium]
MENTTTKIDQTIIEKAKTWLSTNYNQETRTEVQRLIDHQTDDLVESFYKDLEFGTGGLRGIMGVGSNRINKYTVGMTTQGFANYLKSQFRDLEEIKIVIGYDCRNNSQLFAQITADVMSANGIKAYLFENLRPTPEISFAIRELNCQGGVIITASHNPKEYNGYKVYWDDGGQLVAPHDKNVIDDVQKITNITAVNFNPQKNLIEELGKEMDGLFIKALKKVSLSPEIIQKQKKLKIVFTPIHGTSYKLVPQALKAYGFENVTIVKEQAIPDGNFSTVHSPNPEEKAALDMAINLAKEIDADIVMGTDPDADRVGIAVKNLEGEFEIINGNQTGSLLVYYLLTKWAEQNRLDGKQFVAKTIVTTTLIDSICDAFKVDCYDTLTGFKFIADLIKSKEGKQTFIGGGEESYGYLIGDFVRDKDAITSCAILAEIAAWAKEEGTTIYGKLIEIYTQHGLYKERLLSITKQGKSGAEEIQEMIHNLRTNPPTEIDGSKVVMIKDYQSLESINPIGNAKEAIDLPKSNVLQYFTEDGTKVTARPSGTEPKIKFYFSVKAPLNNKAEFKTVNQQLENKLDNVMQSLNLR